MKRFILGVVIVILVCLLGYVGYISYIEINCSVAKDYLVETYEIDEKKLKSKKYTEFVYEDITNCSTLWFKKCTDNKNLKYEYIFELEEETKIIVTEDIDGNMTDNYKIEEKNEEEPIIPSGKVDDVPNDYEEKEEIKDEYVIYKKE